MSLTGIQAPYIVEARKVVQNLPLHFGLRAEAAAEIIAAAIWKATGEKEIVVANHIRQAADDGCQCEPCIAAREALAGARP